MKNLFHPPPAEGCPGLHWSLLQNGTDQKIWIFIHGYSAAADANQVNTLTQHILQARLPGLVYLANWNAGDWKVPCAVPVLRNTWRLCRAGHRLHPGGLAVDAGIWLAGQAWHFKHYERKADRVGRTLPRRLAALSRAREWPVTLVGHSLGTRVIHAALMENEWHGVTIQEVWLLAGAADAHANRWESAARKVKGTVMNAYSKSDHVLTAIPDRRKRVGRNPILSSKVKNIHCRGFGHGDYWPRLGEVLRHPPAAPAPASICD